MERVALPRVRLRAQRVEVEAHRDLERCVRAPGQVEEGETGRGGQGQQAAAGHPARVALAQVLREARGLLPVPPGQ
ncbi:hypothetical protein SALBM135S_05966 [Streptomyces alboniger]